MALSTAGVAAALSHRNDDPWIVLLAVSHSSFSTVYLAANKEDVTSNGQVYTAYPFELILPTDNSGVATSTIRISNVARLIWAVIDGLESQPQFNIKLVLRSQPDTVERTFALLNLRRVTADILSVEGEIGHEHYAVEPWPSTRLTPAKFTWLAK